MAKNPHSLSDSSEYGDSESCESSCSSYSDEDYEYFPWLEKVGPNGDLFYIEPTVYLNSRSSVSDLNKNSSSMCQKSFESSKSRLNPAERFKVWMKKRKRKTRKSFPLRHSKLTAYYENIPFKPFIPLQSRDVHINIDPPRQTLGRRLTLPEELLKLELGSFDVPGNTLMEDKIKILDTLPGHETGNFKAGDWLKCINDTNVDFSNINNVLQGLVLPAKVKLTIVSPSEVATTPSQNQLEPENIIKELLGDVVNLAETKAQLQYIPHGIFYFVIEDNSVHEGVLYRYPSEETPLFQFKGMFITLSHMICDVASPPLLSCSLIVQGQLLHAGFIKEGNEIFVLVLPETCSSISSIQYLSTSLVKLMKLQHPTLRKAFESESNSGHLDQFFTFFLKHHFFKQCGYKNPNNSEFLDILPSVQWLPLPADLLTEIDDILCELESSDFGSSFDGFDGNQRIYSILGSCLFYKGYLLANHLQKSDLLDIHLYLKYNRLLLLTKLQAVSEIIIWKEIFRNQHQEQQLCDPEFFQVNGRWFMLIVAMNQCILCVILEAGGCALKAEGNPPPEPFYVEEVQNTLIILHDCGIPTTIEKVLYECLPPVALPDEFLKDNSSLRISFSHMFSNNSPMNSSVKNSLTTKLEKAVPRGLDMFSTEQVEVSEVERQQLLSSMGPADGESDSSYSDISNDNLSHASQLSKSRSLSSGLATESSKSLEYINKQTQLSYKEAENDLSIFQPRILSGCENTLFHYLHMDPVEGIFLSPLDESLFQESILKDIMKNFYGCCLNLRKVFSRSVRNEKIIESSTVTKYKVSHFLCNAYEQGILFHLSRKDGSKKNLIFWVKGRICFAPEPRELYVCYHVSAQQDLVEVAFRLGFGLSL